MRKYISIILILILSCLTLFIGFYIYNFKDFYYQLFNKTLIQYGLKEITVNDIEKSKTNEMQSYSTDFYTFYYPQDYLLSLVDNKVLFYKDTEKIAELKFINLKSDKFEDFSQIQGNYFFSQELNSGDTINIPELYKMYLVTIRNDLLKKGDIYYISHDLYNENSNLDQFNFKKYSVIFYDETNDFKYITFSDIEDPFRSVIALSNGELLIVGYLTMPNPEEFNYFLGLLSLINSRTSEQ